MPSGGSRGCRGKALAARVVAIVSDQHPCWDRCSVPCLCCLQGPVVLKPSPVDEAVLSILHRKKAGATQPGVLCCTCCACRAGPVIDSGRWPCPAAWLFPARDASCCGAAA